MNQNSQQEQDRAQMKEWEEQLDLLVVVYGCHQLDSGTNNLEVAQWHKEEQQKAKKQIKEHVQALLAAQDRLTEARVRTECAEIIRKKRESVNIFSAETGDLFVSDILKEILIPKPKQP